LGFFSTQFLSILFSGSKRLNTGKSGKRKIKSIQAGMMKTKLRMPFKSLVELKYILRLQRRHRRHVGGPLTKEF